MSLRTSLTPLGCGTKEPFKPETDLVFSAGERLYSTLLPKGVYKICLVGSGGSGYSWWYSSFGWGSGGGSGAAVELIFYNPKKQNIELYAAGEVTSRSTDGKPATMKIEGNTVIIANGGVHGSTSGGTGGTYQIDQSLQVLQILTASNGNNGHTAGSGGVGTIASVSPYNNWGEASEFNAAAGGMRLQYLRRKP